MRIWPKIRGAYFNTKNGLRNIRTFFPAVWRFRSWDWYGLTCLIEVSAREMKKCHRDFGHCVNSDKYAKQLLVVEALCKRLKDDNYFENAGYSRKDWDSLSNFERQKYSKHSLYMANQDAAYLGKMFKFIQHWWD